MHVTKHAIATHLIDTLWNVNALLAAFPIESMTYLIDTLWNVNRAANTAARPPTTFNRYIVECKYDQRDPCILCERDLIDTLWNVNSGLMPLASSSRFI